MKCKPEERLAKRIYKEGCTSKDKERPDLLSGSQKGAIYNKYNFTPSPRKHWNVMHPLEKE